MTAERAIAAVLLDGPWQVDAMARRVRAALRDEEGREPDAAAAWIDTLALDACTTYALAPAWEYERFTAWVTERLLELRALRKFYPHARDRLRVVRYATPAPEMRESPWPVPALATARELASWLGVGVDELDVLADLRGRTRTAPEAARHYRYAWVPKPRGGHRLIEAPKARLRTVQRAILDGIVACVPPHDAAHGFRRGRSVATGAAPHVGRAVVIRVDLRSFFTSVSLARVAGIFRTAGYPEGVAHRLAALCTHRTPPDVLAAAPDRGDTVALGLRHMPQGAPTSGALANLAAYRLDVRVAGLAAAAGAHYTRYADDLVLSGDLEPNILVPRLGAIAYEEGFALSFRKTRVMSRSTRQRITGIVVNDRPSIPRADRERLRAILHNCARHGPASQNRDAHADFRGHLLGRIAWVASIDARQGERLRAVFDRIRWD